VTPYADVVYFAHPPDVAYSKSDGLLGLDYSEDQMKFTESNALVLSSGITSAEEPVNVSYASMRTCSKKRRET
jgi:hypothetical protein